MPDKSTDTYDTLFSAFSGLMHMNNWWWKDDFKMNADWELAERNGWRMNFDETLLGCLFHLG